MSHEMEVFTGLLRGAMAGLLLFMFIGLWLWVFSSRRRATYESAAHLPLEEDRSGVDQS